MRLFIAVPVSPEVKKDVGSMIEVLRRGGADFKWVNPENVHLSVAFLGETAPENVPALEEALSRAAKGRKPFALSFQGLDAFNSLDYPRVLWVPVREGLEALEDLARALRGDLEKAGFLPEDERRRDFRAHLTLGRMRSPRNISGLQEIIKKGPLAGAFRCRADRLALFESRLTAAGPVYAALRERPFSG